MANLAKRRRVVAAAGVGALYAVAVFAAVCAFSVLVILLVFPWRVIDPSSRAYLFLVAAVGSGVVAACLFVIRRLGATEVQSSDTASLFEKARLKITTPIRKLTAPTRHRRP